MSPRNLLACLILQGIIMVGLKANLLEVSDYLDNMHHYSALEQESCHVNAELIVNHSEWLQKGFEIVNNAQGNLSSECYADFSEYTKALQIPNLTKWAIRMADSTGKFGSGILDGNLIFEGRYPQCVAANKDVNTPLIEPMYCLATWITLLPSETPVYFGGLGYCIPDSCSNADAMILLETVYKPYVQSRANITLRCQRDTDFVLGTNEEAIISILILSCFGLLVLIASTYDAFQNYLKGKRANGIEPIACNSAVGATDEKDSKEKNEVDIETDEHAMAKTNSDTNGMESKGVVINMQKDNIDHVSTECVDDTSKPSLAVRLLLCFSLYQNLPLIVSAKQPENSIKCINGLRVIAMSCVVFGHTYASGYIIFDNWKVFYASIYNVLFQNVNAMDVYVDTFLILSAFLVTISFLKQLNRCKGKLKPRDLALHYFNRYWRLTPVYMLILMVYTNLMFFFVPQGPFKFESLVDIDSCSTEWWKNMLYINIYFGKNGPFCFGVSWYLCVDMQLFIIAPLFLYLLYRWEKLGIGAVIAAFCGGIVANIVLFEKYYTQSPNNPDPVDITWDIYMMPWTRCPVYFMGMMLGFYFYKTDGGKRKLPKVVVAIGWIIALSLFFTTTYAPILGDCLNVSGLYDCDWTVAGKVTWSTLYRPMWGIWVCWVILACHAGYGGIVNSFLSWNFFLPLGRLSYLCYLIHVMIIYIYFYGSPVSPYFTHLYLIFAFLGIMVTTYLCSLVAATALSAPLTRLATVFLPGRKEKAIR